MAETHAKRIRALNKQSKRREKQERKKQRTEQPAAPQDPKAIEALYFEQDRVGV